VAALLVQEEKQSLGFAHTQPPTDPAVIAALSRYLGPAQDA